jgi:Zn finger protein HypA/HybF involved in hydrogenase expression
MHEVSLVAELVDACLDQAHGRAVATVRVRHASTVPEAGLRQAFAMLAQDGPLARATLATESFETRLRCPCGFDGPLGHDDLIDSAFAVCPACGTVTSRARTADLELLEVRLVAGA